MPLNELNEQAERDRWFAEVCAAGTPPTYRTMAFAYFEAATRATDLQQQLDLARQESRSADAYVSDKQALVALQSQLYIGQELHAALPGILRKDAGVVAKNDRLTKENRELKKALLETRAMSVPVFL